MSLADESEVFPPEAERCWTWRLLHACGCRHADDCILTTPIRLHECDQDPWRGHLAPTGTGGW